MDESTFETFEEELGTTQQDVPQPKPPRQSRRPEMYPQRKVREEPLVVQQIPKTIPREAPLSRGVTLRKPVSIQNVAQIEAPWEGVTLNRCLFIAITILVLASGCQRIHELLRGHKVGTDIEPLGNVRHTAMRKYRILTPEPETSLWDTLSWWVSDDEDDEKGSRRGKSRKVTREKATRGLRHRAIPDRKLLKGREGRFKARRDKAKRDEEKSRKSTAGQRKKARRLQEKKLGVENREEEKSQESVKAQKEKVKKLREKKLEAETGEEEDEKMVQHTTKEKKKKKSL